MAEPKKICSGADVRRIINDHRKIEHMQQMGLLETLLGFFLQTEVLCENGFPIDAQYSRPCMEMVSAKFTSELSKSKSTSTSVEQKICPAHSYSCKNGVRKTSKDCFGTPCINCNHHGAAEYCWFGFKKESYDCTWNFCPDHGLGLKAQKDGEMRARINSMVHSITDVEVWNALLFFIVIDSQADLDLFSKHCIKISIPYNRPKWNVFASYIEPYETELLRSTTRIVGWDGSNQRIRNLKSINQLYRLMRILGPSHLAVQPLYLSIVRTHSYVAGILLEEPRRATLHNLAEQGWPEYFQMDQEFRDNRMISINEAWLAKLKFCRSELWGAVEVDINLPMLLLNVWHGSLHSIFAPVDL